MAALNSWNGGVVIISHDERFITKVAKEVNSVFVFARMRRYVLTEMGNLAVGVRGRDGYQVQGRRAGL